MIDHAGLAERLDAARRSTTPTSKLSDDHPELTEDDAYAIQDAGIALRVQQGERVVGAKLGFTSTAMQEAMGVDSPNYGWLTSSMVHDSPEVTIGDMIHPKLEPEIAFVMGRDLEGPGIGAADVLAATKAVVPILEIVDSRYEKFQFRALDNTSDNSSAGKIVLGARMVRPSFDLSRVGVTLTVDGDLAYTATGAAVLGHPAASVAWLVRRLAKVGRGLAKGHIVISGGLTGPTDLEPGRVVTLDIDRIGSATCVVT